MEHKKVDLVVIGGGGAGLSAALRAQQLGNLDVVVLENRPYVGGNTGMAGGVFFGAGTKLQHEAGIDIDPEDVIQDALNHNYYDKLNIPLYRRLIKGASGALDWLISIGADYKCDPVMKCHVPTHRDVDFGYFHRYTEMMADQIREAGGTIYTSVEPKKILRDGAGRVSGVLVQMEQEEVLIPTKAVVVTTGGFLGNQALMEKYFPEYYDPSFMTDAILFQGDGIRLVEEAGGQLAKSCTLNFHGGYSFDRRNDYPNKISVQADLWVNKFGRRFVAERCPSPFETLGHMNAASNQPGKIAYAIFDAATVESLAHGPRKNDYPDHSMDDLPEVFAYESKRKKWAITSDSLAEIAEWMGAKPEVLEETVRSYNAACALGRDDQFGKRPDMMIPVNTPPYTAVRFCPLMIETYGPVMTDENLNVVDSQLDPIPGLFAAGVIVSGWQGRDYYLGGSSMGLSITGGVLAAQSIVGYVQH